jgi:cell division transport system permease protein
VIQRKEDIKMKAFRILGRNIADSFKGVFRNFSLSLASISCITITLLLVGFSIIMSYNVNNFTTSIEKDVTIVVFVDRKSTNEETDAIGKSIERLSNIDNVEFVSKEETKKSMQKESEVFDSIMSQYDEETNPLQDSFLVKVVDINDIGKTAGEIEKIEKVSLVKYGEGSVEELVKIFDIVKKISLIAVVALVLVTAFLISNTIKITIQSRGKEIEIMRLVGASNTYIRQPFFFEGIILGLLGSIIPIIALGYGYNYLYNRLGGQLFTAIIKLVRPANLLFDTSISILIVGVVVGAWGSFRAVRKYLKI